MITKEEAFVSVYNGEDLITVVAKIGRKNIIFKTIEMDFEEIAGLIGTKEKLN